MGRTGTAIGRFIHGHDTNNGSGPLGRAISLAVLLPAVLLLFSGYLTFDQVLLSLVQWLGC